MRQFNGYKKCSKCQCVYPISRYWGNKCEPDGLVLQCKDCMEEYNQSEKGKERSRNGSMTHYHKNRYKLLQYSKEYQQTDKGKEVHRIAYKKYRQTEDGKLIYRIHGAKRKGLGYEELFNNIFSEDILVDYHHISDAFVIPIPRHIHRTYNGKEYEGNRHREILKPLIEEMYGISYIVIDR